MKSHSSLALLAVVTSCLLAGCDCDCDKQSKDVVGPRADVVEPLNGAQIGTNAPDGPPPPCSPQSAAGVSGPQTTVTAGTYCVCDIQTHEVHESREAKHLAVGEAVVISPLDWVTHVQLGASSLQMMRSANGSELTVPASYTHRNTVTDESVDITHLVRIEPASGLNTDCDSTKNVLKVSFCIKDTNGAWQCGTRDGAHLGDTHIQN